MSPATRKATVEAAASPTPPPVDHPSNVEEPENNAEETSGSEDEDWDPSEERLPGDEGKKDKGKGKSVSDEADKAAGVGPGGWQAVWAPEQNAYYFWNSVTGEVTWTNPLQPPASEQPPLPNEAPPLPPGPAPAPEPETHPEFGLLPEIDPALARLLPPSQRGMSGPSDLALTQRATFNARTGRFTPANYEYTVDHLDEFNRAKRMNSHYFDVDAWEKQKAEENAKRKREEESGGSSKGKITKKDMDRFRKKAAEKRAKNQAWLRD